MITMMLAMGATRPPNELFADTNRALYELSFSLEDQPEPEEPPEDMATILREFTGLRPSGQNRWKLLAVACLRQLEEALQGERRHECSPDDLELIRTLQKGTHAYRPEAFMRLSRLVRPLALELVAKCEEEHERQLARLRSSCGPELAPLEGLLSEQFIARHQARPGAVPLHFSDEHRFKRDLCCRPEPAELAQLIGLPSGKEAPDERPESLVERQFHQNLGGPCESYLGKLSEPLERAKSAAYFHLNGDGDFVAKRSPDYQLAVFRYKFCQNALNDRPDYVELLAKKLQQEQALRREANGDNDHQHDKNGSR